MNPQFTMRMTRATIGVLAALAAAGTVAAVGGTASAAPTPPPHVSIAAEISHGSHASQPALTSANAGATHACAAVIVVGRESCFALKRDGLRPTLASVSPAAIPAGVGYGPSQLQSAYNLTSASAANGAGRTIAIVDAFDDPTAASDLATYRSSAGLPAVPSFQKVNQNGQTSPLPAAAPASDDWTLEESLDLDMASAICPLCNIVLVEAQDDVSNGLYVAENTAATMAGYISNSWGGSESSSDIGLDSSNFNHPGVVITASAGDSDFGVIYPAASPNVVSVGGTSLSTASNSRGWTESVWNTSPGSEGTGSGCSTVEPKPSWQAALSLPAGCSNRIDNDVAADADPATGVAVYDTSNGDGGWNEVGGTSASSPMLAAMYALAGNPGSTPANDIYTHTSNFFDITSGNDGSCNPAYLCTAQTGYDGPTGIGTPNGIAGLVSGGSTGNTVTVTSPGNQSGTVGTAVSLQVHATDSASGQTLTYTASGLPTGLSMSSAGLISGTPTTAGTFTVVVTATDTTGASGSAGFTWTIGTTGGCANHTQLLGNPGFETGSAAPWTSTAGVINPNGAGETSHSGTWYAWLDGYGTTHTDTLSQTVTIPAGCTATTFSFWLHIDTAETTTTTQFDKLTITANGTTLATFSNLNHISGYAQHSYTLPASFAGTSVTIKFSGTEDASLQTSFVVDDTAISPN